MGEDSPGVEYKRADPTDFAQVLNLLRESGLPTEDLTTETSLDQFWLAISGSSLSGSIGLELAGKHGLLRSLAVTKEKRGMKIGRHLVKLVENDATRSGLEAIYLLTMGAQDYFARLGYQEIDRDTVPEEIRVTSEYSSVCPDSAVCMVKRIR